MQCEENLLGKHSFFLFSGFLFPSSEHWSHSGRSESFPSRALAFSLSSSEQLVSQWTEYEKISRTSTHFSLLLSVPVSIGLIADGVSAFTVELVNYSVFSWLRMSATRMVCRLEHRNESRSYFSVNLLPFAFFLGSPISYMTLQLLHIAGVYNQTNLTLLIQIT